MHCAKEAFETLHKRSSTSVSNSQRVEVVPAPYGVRQSVELCGPFARTASNLTAITALCRYSWPAYDTGTTVGGTQHVENSNDCRPALPQLGIVRDLPFRGVTAAIVGRFAQQPEWRRRQVQYIAARRL